MNKQIIRVAVVEDDSRLRRTFTDILDDADECVGVFATGQQAVRGIPPLAPDVLIMDVNLPDSSTVGTYVQRIYENLHVSSRREIVDRLGKPTVEQIL